MKKQLAAIFQRISSRIKAIWIKVNDEWEKTEEMQRRIDATRGGQLHRYDSFRWHI